MVAKSKSKHAPCKMSASLAALIGAGETTNAAGLASTLAPRSAMAATEKKYHVFVRSNDPEATSIAGVALCKGAGKVMTAIVSATELKKLVAAKQVDRISAPRMMRPLMDVASPLVGVPKFATKNKVSGKGVIIGIIDSGIDLKHPAFSGRVLAIWDQGIDGSGPGPNFSALGSVLRGAAMKTSKDTNGHGTHVAGIAAGKGSVYQGVAPDASFIIVKTNFTNTGIAEGVRWIFSEAAKLGLPCVVNLSLGGHFDGHDGKDDLSVAISDECGSGRLVVAAAGNEGSDPIHTRQLVDAATPARFQIQVNARSSAEPAPFVALNGWYEGKGVCEVRVISSTGAKTPWQGLISTDPGFKSHSLSNDTAIISSPDAIAPNGARQFVIEVQGKNGPVQGGAWTLEVRHKSGTPGMVHVWLLLSSEKPNSARFVTPVFENLIGSPGAAEEVVTVASYTCRNQWVALSGSTETVGLTLNTISEFSSPGPLRDGTLKPDIAAPGAMIASCLSSASPPGSLIAKQYRMMAGTSMACPFIAGILALLLEKKPDTTPAQAKDWLKKKAKLATGVAGPHNIKWGYGLIKL